MNVNLVSDESNGYQYSSYFGEDIVIEPNSKTYLNFASLFRTGEQILTEDATMTLTATELLPRKISDSGGAIIDNVLSQDFTIPAGKYTGLQLQAKIQTLLNDFKNTDEGTQLYYYISDPQEETVPEGAGQMAISLAMDEDEFEATEYDLDPANNFNADGFGGGADGYEKQGDIVATDSQAYDNYANSTEDFWFYSYDSTTRPYDSLVDFTFEDAHLGSVLMGLYGNVYATLGNNAGAVPPMTTGSNRPVSYTVDQPVTEVDPALGFSNSAVLDELGGSDILSTTPAGSFYEGFKVEVTSTSSTAAGYCYVNVTETLGQEGVLDFGNITGSITGAGAVRIDLTTAGGTGAGFVLSVLPFPGGFIDSARIQAEGRITAPGNGYIVGDVLTLTDSGPGVGSIDITVTKVSKYGVPQSFRWVGDTVQYPISPYDDQTAALSMGAGFIGLQQITLSQDSNAGGVVDVCNLSSEATSACFMIPACFIGLNLRGTQSQPLSVAQVAEVYMAQDAGGNFIGFSGSGNTDWASQNIPIKRMKKIAEFPLPGTQPRKHMGIRTYYSTAVDSAYQGDSKKLYFRVVDVTAGLDSDEYILFDSINTGHYFPFSFFIGTLLALRSQTPFRIFPSAQVVNEGFRDIRYPSYIKTKAGATDQYQASIVEKVSISFTSELRSIMGLTAPFPLFPSSQPSDPLTFEIIDIALYWGNKSYYVVIQELPLTNFKNRRAVTADGTGRIKKGMIKNILANIPLPFESISSSLTTSASGAFVGGLYEPNKKIIVDLKNQRISTNRMTVQIFRMEDDTLADEIKQSIINFTIIKE